MHHGPPGVHYNRHALRYHQKVLPQVHPDFQFACGDVVLRLPSAAAPAADGSTSDAAIDAMPAASAPAGDLPAAAEAMRIDDGGASAEADAPEADAATTAPGAPQQQQPQRMRWQRRAEWRVVRNREGVAPYYHNTRTGESVWEKPAVLWTVEV